MKSMWAGLECKLGKFFEKNLLPRQMSIHSWETLPMFEQAFRNIDDALRKEAGFGTELDYLQEVLKSRSCYKSTEETSDL